MNSAMLIKTLENWQLEDPGVQILQCGSSVNNPSARDIDIIIYTCDDLDCYFTGLLSKFGNNDKIRKRYIDVWNMYSLKITENGEELSFHIVSCQDLKRYIGRADEVEIYTDINLFALSMNLPTVYRKWITDTHHLLGDVRLKKELESMLKQHTMPVTAIQDLLRKRILNSINYYHEKDDSALFSGIIVSQIFNDLALYCYAGNHMFYGTLKYLESDLRSFENDSELSRQGIELFQSINQEDPENIGKRLYRIQSLL
ncbi:MAG: hypothetical protein NC392_06325 [Roseburia sp.]|nr:hypothetical protein [Roseburia sp.]MCM1202087.1 hypothetical protein [Bacteroides fragilis]